MIPRQKVEDTINVLLRDASALHAKLAAGALEPIARAAAAMTTALQAGHKIIWFGNGGSATQSQHMAAEFVGRFCKDRKSYPSISLTENMGSVTAIANDYAYDQIFARQLEGLGMRGDVAIGLSTSGTSKNVLAGLRTARELGLVTVGMTGASSTAMQPLVDVCISVPSTTTARVQEAHLTIGHILCALVEDALLT